jgi:hypothetical protein
VRAFQDAIVSRREYLLILWGTPGRGKSTYLSFLIEQLRGAKADGLDATLYGELAAILALCGGAVKNSGKSEASQPSIVAGTGFIQALTSGELRRSV